MYALREQYLLKTITKMLNDFDKPSSYRGSGTARSRSIAGTSVQFDPLNMIPTVHH